MKFDKPSPFEGISPPSFSVVMKVIFCVGLELAMFTMFFAIYTETIGLMDETYLSELPLIGSAFSMMDADANASHIISALLATFSVATPIVLWGEIHRQNILQDPQEWFSHPQNQVLAGLSVLVLALVIGLECVNLYTLIAQQNAGYVFVADTSDQGLMAYLAQNKGLAVGVSLIMALINILLALFTTRALRSLKFSQE